MAYLRSELLEKRRRLLERMQAGLLEPMEPVGVTGDLADMANSTSARETSSEIESAESSAVEQIEHVLHRIAGGKYGVCEDCGKRIPEARLRILPSASLCVECKKRAEEAAERRMMEAAFVPLVPDGLDENGTGDLERRHETIRGRRVA